MDTPCSLRLERLTDISVRDAVLNTANAVPGQITRTLPSNTEPLYVAFGAIAVDATFDNPQLSGNIVPEPSALTLLCVAAAAALHRRKEG